MKILINAPLMGDKITSLLSEYKENSVEFKFIKKTGMKLEFEASNIGEQDAITLIKNLVRETEFGKVLYFSVEVV